jgi:hypothetical protein
MTVITRHVRPPAAASAPSPLQRLLRSLRSGVTISTTTSTRWL